MPQETYGITREPTWDGRNQRWIDVSPAGEVSQYPDRAQVPIGMVMQRGRVSRGWTCDYCGTWNAWQDWQCPSCGGPRL